jgi:hypothetical protein
MALVRDVLKAVTMNVARDGAVLSALWAESKVMVVLPTTARCTWSGSKGAIP